MVLVDNYLASHTGRGGGRASATWFDNTLVYGVPIHVISAKAHPRGSSWNSYCFAGAGMQHKVSGNGFNCEEALKILGDVLEDSSERRWWRVPEFQHCPVRKLLYRSSQLLACHCTVTCVHHAINIMLSHMRRIQHQVNGDWRLNACSSFVNAVSLHVRHGTFGNKAHFYLPHYQRFLQYCLL